MMPQRTFHCHIGRCTKQCTKLEIPEILMPTSRRMSQWTSAKPSREHTSPRKTKSTSSPTNHTSDISKSTSFLNGSTWHTRSAREEMKNSRRGTARQKLACVEATCPPHGTIWRVWNTMFCVTSKKRAKIGHVLYVFGAFFSCLWWRILGDVPQKKFYVKVNAHNRFFFTSKKTTFSYSARWHGLGLLNLLRLTLTRPNPFSTTSMKFGVLGMFFVWEQEWKHVELEMPTYVGCLSLWSLGGLEVGRSGPLVGWLDRLSLVGFCHLVRSYFMGRVRGSDQGNFWA